jgi:hypothetical protein
MPGNKTHDKQIQTFERRDDLHQPTDQPGDAPERHPRHPNARQSEMPVSRGGMNQESRQHNKHNDPPTGEG